MVQLSLEPHHDAVNLHRLLRRLEKSAQSPAEYDGEAAWLEAQKGLQKVNYARRLAQAVDEFAYADGSDLARRLDQIEAFLRSQAEKNAKPVRRPPSILSRIPRPVIPVVAAPELDLSSSSSRRPPPEVLQPSPDNLLLSPPDMDALPSALVSPSFGLSDTGSPPPYQPSFIPPQSTSHSSSINISGSNATQRKPPQPQTTTAHHTSLHEELASQLESMAAQLKRNAIHFSEALADDKAVVEAAGEKLEVNHDVMQREKGRLSLLSKQTGSTTWMTMGIVLAVLLIFVLMVGLIRFSPI